MVNMSNVRLMSKIQSVFTITKILALLIIIFAGFFNYFQSSQYSPSDVINNWFIESEFNFDGLAKGIYSGLFAYSGW
jgi:amino acid transporter